MPSSTYTALATLTLASTDSSISFASIPATYRDLVIVIDGTISAGGGEVVRVNFNGDGTSGNYPAVYMDGAGSGSGTSSTDNRRFGLIYATRTNIIAQLNDYSATDKNKTWLSRANGANNAVFASAGRWANNAAIHTVTIFPDANSFAIGSTFSLFGIVS